MKKLLFLLGCLLLLAAAAAPASAADKIQWQVIIGPHWSGEPVIVQVNYTAMTFTDIDENGAYFTAVPATATDVVVGDATPFVTRGNTQAFAKALFQRMTIDDPSGKRTVDVDEAECHQYLVPIYPYNDFSSYYGPLLPYNTKIGGGMMWETDWMVPLPLNADGKLTPGPYTVTYNQMLAHTVADPMFPGRVPGKVGYPPIGHAAPWWDEPGTLTFWVE
jgi:hypothetical protein